jgi:endoglucanase
MLHATILFHKPNCRHMNRKPGPLAFKKIIVCSLFPLLVLFTPILYGQGFLKTKGKIIVNEKGEKVILRGMGLGGWMLQEGYMFRVSNLGQQYKIKAAIEDLVGAAETNIFYEKWLTNNTRRQDIDSLAAWGFNSIRLPFHYNLFTLAADEEPVPGKDTWLKKGFDMTDSLLQWCKANKMYLILDLHAAPGGQGNDLPISDRNPAKPSLWESEANRTKTIALWRKLAEHYANEPWIGGYDIINEPNWGFEDPKDVRGTAEKKNEPLKKLLMDMTAAIRAVDKKHIIIIEGNGFGNNYSGILPAWDDNMVLSFHKYGNFNNEQAIKRFLDLRDTYNMPLWLGESGENSNTWFTEAIGLAERNDIGWAWWQLKKIGINNPLEIKQPDGYDQLLDYWSGKGPKPSAAFAKKVLDELLDNIKIENNVYHRDVTDAMIRQVSAANALPYKNNILAKSVTINAVDYDLGSQRNAYFDRDSASYRFTPGVNTTGNRGRTYRNDGVDIQKGKDGPYIFSIEDGEWLQYTVQARQTGIYNISLQVSATADTGRVSLLYDQSALVKQQPIPATGGEQQTQTLHLKDIRLEKGVNRLRVYADKGGFNLYAITISQRGSGTQ